tara:strand:- start:2044 stop:3450 length:1407 start_codon:yes stop_codon:yes gene_type:complete
MKKQKKSAPRDKNTGKFVSSELSNKATEAKKTDYTFKVILVIVIVFFLILILNNTRMLNSLESLNFERINKKETIDSSMSTNEILSDENENNNVKVEIDSTDKGIKEDSLNEPIADLNQIARILVQYGNVSILSKGDSDPNKNLYPGKLINNGDQITVGEYPSYISFIINNDNSVIVMYDNTNAQIVFNETTNLYKVKKGKIHANIMSSSKPTNFISQHSIATIDKQNFTLMNLIFDEVQDQFVTINGEAYIKNELSGLSLRMIKEQKLFSTNAGQLIWSLAKESDYVMGPKKELVVLPIKKEPVKKVEPIKTIKEKIKVTPKPEASKPKIIINEIKPVAPKPVAPKPVAPKPAAPKPIKNYDATRDYDFNIAIDIIKRESIVTYLETPLMGDIPVYIFPNTSSELVSSISDQEKFIVYPIYRSGFVVVGRLGTGPLGYADADLINFSSEDRLGKIIDLSKNRFTIDN